MEYRSLDTKTLCLAVLSMGDASGYDIKKRIEEVFSRFVDVAPSGIYAALKTLDREGLVSSKVVPQEGKPNKTVYALLPPGRDNLVAALKASEGRHRIRSELIPILMFADILPVEKLREVLENRIRELEQIRAEMPDACAGKAGHRFLVGMGSTLIEAELGFLRTHLQAFLAELSATDTIQKNESPIRQSA